MRSRALADWRAGIVLLALLTPLTGGAAAQPAVAPQAPAAPQAAVPSQAAAAPQAPAAPQTPEALPPAPVERDTFDETVWRRPVFRVGGDYRLPPGDAVREVVVVYGDAIIDGRVDRDVVVIFGRAQLWSNAAVGGSLVVIGGNASVSAGAAVDRDLVIVGSTYDAPPDFSPGGESVVIGSKAFGGAVEAIVPWISRGLLWGRIFVPGLAWMWIVAGIFFLLYLALNLIFDKPVRACADALVAKPLTAFGAGLLVLLLIGPVCFLLAVSVVGIAVIPFVLCALVAAWIVGRVSVARWIGLSVVPHDDPDSRLQATRSFAIGFVVICLAYMLPIVGIITWMIVGVLGLGAAMLAFLTAYRRENPIPVRARQEPVPAVPAVGPMHTLTPTVAHDEQGAPMQSQNARAAFDQPLAPPIAVGASAVTAPSWGSDVLSFPRASLLERGAAGLLDFVLVMIGAQLLHPLTPVIDDSPRPFLLLLLAYFIGFWTWKGTTVGGIICQLRVVRMDGAPLRFADALVRGLSGIFSVAVVGIGFFWLARDPERQSWHDKIAGTYVVKVPRNFPL